MKENEFEYFTYEEDHEYGDVKVYGWGRYEESSVLAGQPRKVFMGAYDSMQEALCDYPEVYESHPALEIQARVPECPPDDFSPLDAGEAWSEDDY